MMTEVLIAAAWNDHRAINKGHKFIRAAPQRGRIELGANSIERVTPPFGLSRKNSLFAGSDRGGENWACLASVIGTRKLNSVNQQTHIADLLLPAW